jgi:hypothetical protein
MSAPHMRLKSAFRQRSSPSQFIAARALRRVACPVETSSLDDLRATVKEPPLALEPFWQRKAPGLAVRTRSPSPRPFLYLARTFPVPCAHSDPAIVNSGVMRFDRKLGATAGVASRLLLSVLFAPHAAVARPASHSRPHYCKSHYSVRRVYRRAILINCAPIRNPSIPLKQNTMSFFDWLKSACLRPCFSHVLHSTNHQPYCSPHAFLIASPLLEIELTRLQQTRKQFLIASFSALSSHRTVRRDRENEPVSRYAPLAPALTTLHPSPTMKSVPGVLYGIANCAAAVTHDVPLITDRHTPVTGANYV